MRVSTFLAFLILLITGCTEPKLNGSSKEAFQNSVTEMKQNISDDKAAKVDSALKIIGVSEIQNESSGGLLQLMNSQLDKKLIRTLDEKTASDIIAMADSILQDEFKRQKQQALKEIKRLEEKREAYKNTESLLSRFKVQSARTYYQEDMFTDKLIIELTITNNTGTTISKFEAFARVSSAGRDVPWHQGEFNYEINGAIQTGETKTWKLVPNQFSGWGDIPDRNDLITTVEIKTLFGPQGNDITNAKFTDSDSARLKILKDVYTDE
ncbi:hypothetical protein NC796_06450 [Aliifodinibius sp. S!AR15-10]|uniref:DUF6694 family lipoprotein n=1 Tax=Aliifodinibius sp. S!AR15-10 TaxID=2950437 RepID=UPI002857DC8D|nr:DUF6694 family lipoprotein [Aliifodinibius sp. S!AR15-10]MDR8390768.1 hypothetical protein [Aliifodinibius sp. S!AR15-10]